MAERGDARLGFLFPGQGSQSVGMLAALAAIQAEVTETFAEASAVLGFDLWEIVQNGPEERLNATEVTQPAMLAAGVACWRVWCAHSAVRPAWMAGHSLGEYTALVCAGALQFPAAVGLVAERARAMQAAVPAEVGAMAAILGLGDQQVVAVCDQASTAAEIVTAANFNAPGQVVIAGNRPAVARAIELAKSAGAKRAVLLAVSVPSHCPLMQPAAGRFAARLAATPISPPTIPVIHNVDAAPHGDPAAIRQALCDQLFSPVRWSESIAAMAGLGVTRLIECGPGRVLTGLNKRIVPSVSTAAIFDPESLANALELDA